MFRCTFFIDSYMVPGVVEWMDGWGGARSASVLDARWRVYARQTDRQIYSLADGLEVVAPAQVMACGAVCLSGK